VRPTAKWLVVGLYPLSFLSTKTAQVQKVVVEFLGRFGC
jgi:hypothetical protein